MLCTMIVVVNIYIKGSVCGIELYIISRSKRPSVYRIKAFRIPRNALAMSPIYNYQIVSTPCLMLMYCNINTATPGDPTKTFRCVECMFDIKFITKTKPHRNHYDKHRRLVSEDRVTKDVYQRLVQWGTTALFHVQEHRIHSLFHFADTL